MTTVELPATHAPMPHALILDPRVSPGAVRLYGLLHYYGWTRQAADPQLAAEALGVDVRTVYRWAGELEAAQWVAYDRQPGRRGWGQRLVLRDTKTSDTTITGRKTSDRRIATSDTRITTSDRSVRGSQKTVHQDAVNDTPQISSDHSDLCGGGIHAPAKSEPATPPNEDPVFQELTRLGVGADRARDLAPRATLEQVAYLEASGREKARDLAGWVVSGITRGIMPPPAAQGGSRGGSHPGDYGPDRAGSRAGAGHRGGGAGRGGLPAHAPAGGGNRVGSPPPGLSRDEQREWIRERVRAIQATRC